MKILLFSCAGSRHTIRWANAFRKRGHDVYLVSCLLPVEPLDVGVKFVHISMSITHFLKTVFFVKKVIGEFRPDVIHAHYASRYGALAALTCKKFIVSVWGSDVYEFPKRSLFHLLMLKWIVSRATFVTSTSRTMADDLCRLVPSLVEPVYVVPFGVDVPSIGELGRCSNCLASPRSDDLCTIGTVKVMSDTYGIDVLIKAFSILHSRMLKKFNGLPKVELVLVGGGVHLKKYINLADQLGIADSVKFVGDVAHSQVPNYLKSFDIFAALSRAESFGVSMLEAGAMALPVVATNVGGIPEVVVHGKTGILVESEDEMSAARALERLVINANLRRRLGTNARQFVIEKYQWNNCVDLMLQVYGK